MMDPERNEYELALRARDGDLEALTELVERTRLRLFALAYAELRHYEDAQDAVAAALLQVCRHVDELREPARLRAWMQSIVRNEVRRLRRGLNASTASVQAAEPWSEETGPWLLRLDIERALRRLPGNQAEVMRLFYLDNLSIHEIARRLGRSQGTIGSWLHRGRQQLAAQLEGYAPMTSTEQPTAPPAQPPRAALVHTDLEPALVQQVTDALRTGGYSARVITPEAQSFLLILDRLQEYQVIILDEWIGGRSAFELLINLKANPETSRLPICLLCTAPLAFTASAYFATGVSRLVDKQMPDELARLAEPFEGPAPGLWAQITERARRVLNFVQEEAVRSGASQVGTEHLLIGLIGESDCGAARLLERLGVPIDRIRSEILQTMGAAAEPQRTQARRSRSRAARRGAVSQGPVQLTPRASRALEFAYQEARLLQHNFIGTDHFLLGLLREGEGLAAKILTQLGANLESARCGLVAMRQAAK